MTRAFYIGLPLAVLASMVACDGGPTEAPVSSSNDPAHAVGSDTTTGASIATDKDDYAPGDTVRITGTGWAAGEPVHFQLARAPQTADATEWDLEADANGQLETSYVVQDTDLGVTFTLTATGPTSGSVVETVFTDGTINVRASAGVTFTLVVVAQYNNATCSGTPNSSTDAGTYDVTASSLRKQGTTSDVSLSIGSGKSEKLTPAANSNQGGSWQSWTTVQGNNGSNVIVDPSPSGINGPREICVAGGQATTTFTATYGAPPVSATTTELTSSANPSTSGQSLTFTATVKSGSPAAAIGATGAVTFKSGGASCADATALPGGTGNPNPANLDASGAATYTTSTLPTGSTTIRACYGGHTTAPLYAASETSLSQAVNAPAPTKLAFTTAAFNTMTGQCSPKVTIATQNAGGTATNPLATVTVNLSTTSGGGAFFSDATCATAVTSVTVATSANTADFYYRDTDVGTPTLTAADAATSNPLASATQQETVTQSATTTTVTTSKSPTTYGDAVTFTATVKRSRDNSAVTAGSVTFKAGGSSCTDGAAEDLTGATNPVSLDGTGKAAFTTSTLDARQTAYVIRACYGGTTGLAASGNTVNQTVDPRPITMKANDAPSIVYGMALPSGFGYTLTGSFVGSDETAFAATLSYAVSGTDNADGFRNVGSYTITPSWTYANGNYTITLATPGTGSLAVTPRPVSVKANDAGPINYGDALPTFGVTLGGSFVGNDGAAFASTVSYGLSGAANADGFRDAGSYTITPQWTYSNANYDVSLASPGTGSLRIDPRPIAVKANDPTAIVYGTAAPTSFTYALTGNFVGGDQAAFAATLSYTIGGTPNQDNFLDAGSYPITPAWTYNNANYAITLASPKGSLTVNQRPITVQANDAGPIYFGDALPAFSFGIVTGSFVGSDQAAFTSAVTYQLSSTASPLPVGTYTISLVGYTNPNYAITRNTGSLSVLAWTLKGFYQPVDMNADNTSVFNTVKGGSTVPLKFEVFSGSTEHTSTADVKSFVQTKVSCPNAPVVDEIEIVSTGGTSLRYDTVAGQFIQNWQTPKQPGACYRVTMTTQDLSPIVAYFLLK